MSRSPQVLCRIGAIMHDCRLQVLSLLDELGFPRATVTASLRHGKRTPSESRTRCCQPAQPGPRAPGD